MPSCLGLYIEDNLIKYAKVSKSNDVIKVESFGVKFYDNISETIKQIIEETYSFKLPISINTTDEIYNNIEVFSLLSKKDIDNVIKTEFENICYDKDINKNIYEQRYILTNSDNGSEKIKAMHVSVQKTAIEQRKNQFGEYKINNILPISITIPNLIKRDKKGVDLFVNIEKRTTVTKVNNGVVSDISVLNIGSNEILEKINKKENSYSKAYEICKSSTIYTESDRDLQYEENEYLEDIMPTLFQIVSQIRNIVDNNLEKIDNIYITGTGSIINNIDIYFQDYLKNIHCEILKPSFINNNSKINIKDYIEVNSAVSLALHALEKDTLNVNFTKESSAKKIMSVLTSNIGSVGSSDLSKSFNGIVGIFGKQYNVVCTTATMFVFAYIAASILINMQMNNKMGQAETSIANTNDRINQVQEYNDKFNSLTSKYESLIKNIEDSNDANSENKRFRNAIPNLLNNIMVVIPKEVQLTSIENTADTHIVIKAKSAKYEQIAYFKTKLKTEGILDNVVSDTGTAQGGYLSVTIEGELP